MTKYVVVLGLGSNVGNRIEWLRSAVALLVPHIENMRISSIYESAALLPEGAPDNWDMPFYNMAVSGVTSLSPDELLLAVKQIEQKLGRNKTGHWSPREIDIDILAMGDLVLDSADLSLPHKELVNRDFALIPMAEIIADWQHPVLKKSSRELAGKFSPNNLKLLKRPGLVGIINITPDSFSDGGVNLDPAVALENIYNLINDGADVIDIGAESTRPMAVPISQEEEWARLETVMPSIKKLPVPVSIDTRYAKTAEKAILHGAGWINDVSGFSSTDMVDAVRDSDCKLVVMHSLSVPADKNIVLPLDCDPVEFLISWAERRFADLKAAGIDRERIIFDPGIGFGKNAGQSNAIIQGVGRFKVLGVPILIGHSRKSFLGANSGDDATVKTSHFLADNGVDYLRVHNIRRHRLELL